MASGTSETSLYTVDINHVRNNPDVATHAMRLNVDLQGADNTTADRLNSGLLIDVDSSATEMHLMSIEFTVLIHS